MALLVEFEGKRPQVGDNVFLAPNATLIGDVRIGDDASIWFGAVLRGDFSHIEVGAGSSVQDNAVIHCAAELPTVVGRNVTVGHGAVLEGCVIADGALVGMGAVVCQRARLRPGAMLAAGSVLSERAEIDGGALGAGVPARVKKTLDGPARRWTEMSAAAYRDLKSRYLTIAVPNEENPTCPR